MKNRDEKGTGLHFTKEGILNTNFEKDIEVEIDSIDSKIIALNKNISKEKYHFKNIEIPNDCMNNNFPQKEHKTKNDYLFNEMDMQAQFTAKRVEEFEKNIIKYKDKDKPKLGLKTKRNEFNFINKKLHSDFKDNNKATKGNKTNFKYEYHNPKANNFCNKYTHINTQYCYPLKFNSDNNINLFNPYLSEQTNLLDLHQNKFKSENQSETIAFTYKKDNIFFNNKKINDMSEKEVKCIKCRKPYKRLNKDDWKNLCIYCYLKEIGILVKCKQCPKNIYISEKKKNTDYKCKDCYVKENGIKNICFNYFCKNKTYYRTAENTELVTYCEDCYLRINGEKLNCKDCKREFYVYKRQKSWKNRCYDCWILWK